MGKRVNGFFAMLLTLLMVIGTMTACGSNSGEVGSTASAGVSNTAASQTSSGEATKLKEATIKIYFAGTKPAAADEVWKTVAEKTKDKLNAKFEINFTPFEDYVNKITLLIASGDTYDMNFDGNWLAYSQIINKGGYKDIMGLLPQYAPNYYKQLQDQKMIDSISFQGKLYAMPWTQVVNDHPWIGWDIANTGLKDKGFNKAANSVHTLEDMDSLFAEMKKLLPNKHVFEWDANIQYGGVFKMILPKYNLCDSGIAGLVYNLDDPACKLMPFENTPAFKEAAAWTKKWVDAGYIPKDLMINNQSYINEPASEKVSKLNTTEYIYFNGRSEKGEEMFSELYPDGKYEKKSPLSNIMCLNQKAANPERSLMFMDILSSDQSLYDLVLYGIEGKTYVKKDGAYVFPNGMDSSSSNYMEWSGQWGLWRAGMMRPTANHTANDWAKISEYTNKSNSVLAQLAGFFPDTSAVKTEFAKRIALYDEVGKPIVMGVVPDVDKAIADYQAKAKTAGTDKIVEEIQKQVDKYLSSK